MNELISNQSMIYLTVSKSAVWLKAYPLKSRSFIKYSVIFRPEQVNLVNQKIVLIIYSNNPLHSRKNISI